MRKLGICSLVLVVILLVAAGSSFAVTRTVCASGCGFTTINAAIAASAASGDTISVKPGYYNENVLVNKSVIIVSTGGRLVTTVQSTGAAFSAFTVTANNVAINGFRIWAGNSAHGVLVQTGNNVRVKNCIIEKCGIGVALWVGANNATISSNIIRLSTLSSGSGTPYGSGVLVYSTGADITNAVITLNQIVDNDAWGIYVVGTAGTPSFDGMRIGSNTLVNNGAADVSIPNNHNWNTGATCFQNAFGTITLNNNKIWGTTVFTPFYKVGGGATYVGTGNAIYNNCNKNVGGTATPLSP